MAVIYYIGFPKALPICVSNIKTDK